MSLYTAIFFWGVTQIKPHLSSICNTATLKGATLKQLYFPGFNHIILSLDHSISIFFSYLLQLADHLKHHTAVKII